MKNETNTAAPAAPARETDWNMREILSRAAPAPVAGDADD